MQVRSEERFPLVCMKRGMRPRRDPAKGMFMPMYIKIFSSQEKISAKNMAGSAEAKEA